MQRLGRDTEAETCRQKLIQLQDASAEIKQLLAKLPDAAEDPETLHRLGELYADIEFLEDARVWFRRALDADPNHEASRSSLRELGAGSANNFMARPR